MEPVTDDWRHLPVFTNALPLYKAKVKHLRETERENRPFL